MHVRAAGSCGSTLDPAAARLGWAMLRGVGRRDLPGCRCLRQEVAELRWVSEEGCLLKASPELPGALALRGRPALQAGVLPVRAAPDTAQRTHCALTRVLPGVCLALCQQSRRCRRDGARRMTQRMLSGSWARCNWLCIPGPRWCFSSANASTARVSGNDLGSPALYSSNQAIV